jgi:hypothetical protein
MIESHPLPKTARTAFALTKREYDRACLQIANDAVEDLGLDAALPWRVDLDAGTIARDVADAPIPSVPPAPPTPPTPPTAPLSSTSE